MREVDFIARLSYLKPENGGRSTPAASGYRPQLKFDFTEMQTSGMQTFLDREFAYPGDEVTAEIRMSRPDIFLSKLASGMRFEFREGAHIIGTGEIIEILNKPLQE